MAVVLIISGVLMIVSRILNISALEYFIKFWPISLFLLGGEVLYFYFKYKDDEDVKIGYDFLSIMIVLVIIGVNFGLYTFMETGILEGLKNIGSIEERVYKIDDRDFSITDNIEKIIVEDIENTDLTIKTGEEKNLRVGGELSILSGSKSDFNDFIKDDFIKVKESGKVLYLTFNTRENNSIVKDMYKAKMTITIPSDEMLEVSKVGNVNINLTELREDIVLNDANNIKINIDNPIDFNLLAQISDKERFLGSADWKIEEAKNEDGEIVYFIGKIKEGESEHTIKILNCRSIEVNKL